MAAKPFSYLNIKMNENCSLVLDRKLDKVLDRKVTLKTHRY
jgi:hypothetical protein